MSKQIINAAALQGSPFFTHAVKAGSMIYLSGLVGFDPATNKLAGPSIEQQTRQSLENCKAVLHAAGSSLENVVEVQVLLANAADFAGMNSVYLQYFPESPPARSVAKLGVEIAGMLVSIRMTATG